MRLIYHKSLLSITVIALLLVQADAEPVDPLDPIQLGETMSMPLPQEPQPETDADNSLDDVNITGAWSINLKGKVPAEQMKLYLIQIDDTVTGKGVINRGNGTENVAASGSISEKNMSLTVKPIEVLDLYKLNFSLSSLAAGTYTVYMADGSNRSGKVTFSVTSNIFKPASKN